MTQSSTSKETFTLNVNQITNYLGNIVQSSKTKHKHYFIHGMKNNRYQNSLQNASLLTLYIKKDILQIFDSPELVKRNGLYEVIKQQTDDSLDTIFHNIDNNGLNKIQHLGISLPSINELYNLFGQSQRLTLFASTRMYQKLNKSFQTYFPKPLIIYHNIYDGFTSCQIPSSLRTVNTSQRNFRPYYLLI